MDYSKNIDLTVDNNGKPSKRRYPVSGKKEIAKCKSCAGSVIQYVEDTKYICDKHKTVPIINSLVCDDNGVCRKK